MKWLNQVAPDDYTSARTYLTLKLDATQAEQAVQGLQNAPIITLRANDILRASGYTPLSKKDPGVKQELQKDAVSAVLIVSYEMGCDIADGFHRICAAYNEDPETEIPAKVYFIELSGCES